MQDLTGNESSTVTESVGTPLALLVWDDVRRVFAALLCGCAVAALGEYAITLVAAPGRLALGTVLRFLLLDLVLFGAVYLVVAPMIALVAAAARLALLADSGQRARSFRGLLAAARPARRRESRPPRGCGAGPWRWPSTWPPPRC